MILSSDIFVYSRTFARLEIKNLCLTAQDVTFFCVWRLYMRPILLILWTHLPSKRVCFYCWLQDFFFFFWCNFLINKFPFSSQNNWYPPVCLVVFYAVCFMACFDWGRDLYWFVYRHDKYWPYRQPIQYNIENFDLCYKESHIWTKTHWPAQYFFIANGTDPKAPTPTMVFFSLVLMYPP